MYSIKVKMRRKNTSFPLVSYLFVSESKITSETFCLCFFLCGFFSPVYASFFLINIRSFIFLFICLPNSTYLLLLFGCFFRFFPYFLIFYFFSFYSYYCSLFSLNFLFLFFSSFLSFLLSFHFLILPSLFPYFFQLSFLLLLFL